MQSKLRLVFAAFALAACAPWAAQAQAPTASDPRCPPGYWRMDALCQHGTSGDIIYATPPADAVTISVPGCRPGYWRHDSLCHSSQTGDVEVVDESRWPARSSGARSN